LVSSEGVRMVVHSLERKRRPDDLHRRIRL
jgi:hypothetical protein